MASFRWANLTPSQRDPWNAATPLPMQNPGVQPGLTPIRNPLREPVVPQMRPRQTGSEVQGAFVLPNYQQPNVAPNVLAPLPSGSPDPQAQGGGVLDSLRRVMGIDSGEQGNGAPEEFDPQRYQAQGAWLGALQSILGGGSDSYGEAAAKAGLSALAGSIMADRQGGDIMRERQAAADEIAREEAARQFQQDLALRQQTGLEGQRAIQNEQFDTRMAAQAKQDAIENSLAERRLLQSQAQFDAKIGLEREEIQAPLKADAAALESQKIRPSRREDVQKYRSQAADEFKPIVEAMDATRMATEQLSRDSAPGDFQSVNAFIRSVDDSMVQEAERQGVVPRGFRTMLDDFLALHAENPKSRLHPNVRAALADAIVAVRKIRADQVQDLTNYWTNFGRTDALEDVEIQAILPDMTRFTDISALERIEEINERQQTPAQATEEETSIFRSMIGG